MRECVCECVCASVCECVCVCASVCVCVCVCSQSASCVGHFYSKLNMAISFSEDFKDLKLTELSFSGVTASFAKFSATLAILFACGPLYTWSSIYNVYTSLVMLLV